MKENKKMAYTDLLKNVWDSIYDPKTDIFFTTA